VNLIERSSVAFYASDFAKVLPKRAYGHIAAIGSYPLSKLSAIIRSASLGYHNIRTWIEAGAKQANR
jgi:hypothetical protein